MWKVALRMIAICYCIWILPTCSSDSLTPAEYVQYIRNPKNGYCTERQDQTGIWLEAFYQPPAYAALMQVTPENMNDTLLRTELDRASSFYRFMLSVGSITATRIDEVLEKTVHDKGQFDKKKQQMLYNIQNNFMLLIGKDSLPCAFYHAQPSGKVDNAYHFVIDFESDSPIKSSDVDTDLILVYKDSLWLQKRIEFAFDKNKINQSPRLKL